MNLPKISIITPNYNYSQFIGQTIESVLNQDYNNIEHIIVDDGSTDNSVEIIQKYVLKFPGKIKLITQPNRGQTHAINAGLSEAKGDIIGWINSDDVYCKDAIKHSVKEFEKEPCIDIIFGDFAVMDQNGDITKIMKQLPIDKITGTFIGFGRIIASNTVFWRSKLMDGVGFLKEDFIYNMDGEYFSRLFNAGKSLHIDKCIAKFRIHPHAKSSEYNSHSSFFKFNAEKMKRSKFELNYEIQNSYSILKISKIIPYRYSTPIKIIFRFKRIVLRLFRGHYFNM